MTINHAIRQSGFDYWDNATIQQKVCSICNKRVKFRDKSIDHIIPRSIIYKTGLVALLYDHRNFRITHKECNMMRGDDTSDLPPAIIAKLQSLGYTN